MCLAIPGKIIEVYEENELKMGKIDFSGSVNTACLAYVPEAETGQYVVVHAGFAIQVLDEQQAQEVFEAWDDLTDTLKEDGYKVTSKPLSNKKKDIN